MYMYVMLLFLFRIEEMPPEPVTKLSYVKYLNLSAVHAVYIANL